MLTFLVRGVIPVTLGAAGLQELGTWLVLLPEPTPQLITRPEALARYTLQCRQVHDEADRLAYEQVTALGPEHRVAGGTYRAWHQVLAPHILRTADRARHALAGRWPVNPDQASRDQPSRDQPDAVAGHTAAEWAYQTLTVAADLLARTTAVHDAPRVTALAAAHNASYTRLVEELRIAHTSRARPR